jgi:transcriptional regulator with XRE-family HTH domain
MAIAPTKNRSQTKDAAAVTSLRRQLGLTQQSLARLLGVHAMTVSAWERDKLRLTTWQRSLVAALLLSQPRANLEQRLKDSESNPILVLAHLLSDGIRPSALTVASVPFLPSPPAPAPTPPGRARRLPATPATTPALPTPPAPLPLLPPVPVESTRFSLLEIDEPSED